LPSRRRDEGGPYGKKEGSERVEWRAERSEGDWERERQSFEEKSTRGGSVGGVGTSERSIWRCRRESRAAARRSLRADDCQGEGQREVRRRSRGQMRERVCCGDAICTNRVCQSCLSVRRLVSPNNIYPSLARSPPPRIAQQAPAPVVSRSSQIQLAHLLPSTLVHPQYESERTSSLW
jgi:hypothetical protein